jgi:ABC-type Na+ transport system ATPase subunit NatA
VSATGLLEHEAARIALSGGSITPPLTLRGAGSRLALVGSFTAFFALLSGEASLASGTARVHGDNLASAVQRGIVGLALSDPALPLRWTAERYLVESAELSGLSTREARRTTFELLQRFELTARARHELKDLLLIERRALILAGATIGAPGVLVAQAPLARLDVPSQRYVQDALARAAEGRELIVSVPALPPAGAERGLVDAADQVIWEHPGAAPASDRADGPRRVTLSVLDHGDALCAALREQGIGFETLPVDPLLLALSSRGPQGVSRLLIELPPALELNRLLELASAAEAPVVELASS